MEHRLTLEERDSIAIKLRRHILSQEDYARLAAIEHPDLQPNEVSQGVYAFEFFLDRYRVFLSKNIAQWVSYTAGWSKTALAMDEQTRSSDRLIRMCATLCMKTAIERGEMGELFEAWKSAELGEFPPIEDDKLELFLYEIVYEIIRELARKWIIETWDKKKK